MKNVDFENQSLAENMNLNITWQEGSLNESYIHTALNCDLELESDGWNISFAYSLTEVNIWLKLNKTPSRDKRDMERTGNQKFKLMTFDCDLDLEPTCWVHGFCTLPYWAEHLTKILSNSF